MIELFLELRAVLQGILFPLVGFEGMKAITLAYVTGLILFTRWAVPFWLQVFREGWDQS